MKKNVITSTILAIAMACTLGACAGKTDNSTTGNSSAAATSEDGQNPIMNFIGPYASARANILIEADGMEGAKVMCSWANSSSETVEWIMSGTFDTNTLTISYNNGTKTVITYNDDGSVANEEVAYTDGSGTLTFTEPTDGGKTKLTWNDNKEHVADGMEFVFNF